MTKTALDQVRSYIAFQRLNAGGAFLMAFSAVLSGIVDGYPLESRFPFRVAQVAFTALGLLLMVAGVYGMGRAQRDSQIAVWQRSQAEKKRNIMMLSIGGATTVGALAMLAIAVWMGLPSPNYFVLIFSAILIGGVVMLIAECLIPRMFSDRESPRH